MKLSENQKRILYLINLYTQNNQNSWIREETLLGLIYYFVKRGVFDEPYDYAPSPYLWNGEIKYINISHEALFDLDFLLENELCYEILLSAKNLNYFIKGYRIGNFKLDNTFDKYKDEFSILFDNDKLKEVTLYKKGIKIGNDVIVDITKLNDINFRIGVKI
jgi:hypothetical protein